MAKRVFKKSRSTSADRSKVRKAVRKASTTMKTTLKLESIESTDSRVEFVNIICKMPFKSEYSETLTVKLRSTGLGCRIMSDHLVYEMKHICDNLETVEVSIFAKEMLQANKTLKEVRNI